MRLTRMLVLLGLLSGEGTAPVPPDTAEVAVVFQSPPSPGVREMLRELIEALSEDDRVEMVRRIPFTVHSTRRGLSRPEYLVPGPSELVTEACRADRVICVGNAALRPFLQGDPPGTAVYSLGAEGLAHLPDDNRLLPNLHRLRGAVPLDMTLASAVRGAGLALKNPSPMGAIVSDRAPTELINEGISAARDLDYVLYVQRIADPRELLPAVDDLLVKGIRNLLFLPDLNAMASPAGMLSRDKLRLMLLREGVAVMGMRPGDANSHYAFQPDYGEAARVLASLVLEDLDSDEPPDRGVVLLHSFSTWVNVDLASLHSVELNPSPKPLR